MKWRVTGAPFQLKVSMRSPDLPPARRWLSARFAAKLGMPNTIVHRPRQALESMALVVPCRRLISANGSLV